MSPKCSCRNVALLATLLLGIAIVPCRADSPSGKGATPQPLPEKVVKAWSTAGCQVAWMVKNKEGSYGFGGGKTGNPGDIPAFGVPFDEWQDGRLAKLPAPAAPFGLQLAASGVTDSGLKDLAGFTNLQVLHLNVNGKVTDKGLKSLAGLKNLKALSLLETGVTDAGLKELAGLKNLETLDLRHCFKLTKAGVKELQTALPKCKIVHHAQ